MYFNLGALESLWQNEHYPSFYFDQTGRFSGQGGAYMKLHLTNAEGWSRSPRRRRYNLYEPEASLRHLNLKSTGFLNSSFVI